MKFKVTFSTTMDDLTVEVEADNGDSATEIAFGRMMDLVDQINDGFGCKVSVKMEFVETL